MDRVSWDVYFLEIAKVVAIRAACTRSQVGAVLVKDNRIHSTGYNGAPSGEVHCIDGGCPRGKLTYEELAPGTDYGNCIASHAEANALAFSRTEARGGTMYITRNPCYECSKLMKTFGIVRVAYIEGDAHASITL